MLRPRRTGSNNGIGNGFSSSSSSSSPSDRRRSSSMFGNKSSGGSSSPSSWVITLVIIVTGVWIFAVVNFSSILGTMGGGVGGNSDNGSDGGGVSSGGSDSSKSVDSSGSGGTASQVNHYKWELPEAALEYKPKIAHTPQPYKPPKKSLFRKDTNKKQFEKRDKKTGKLVYKPITEFHKDDIGDTLVNPNASSTMSYEEAVQGRERLVDILHDAGVEQIDVEVVASLPKWEDVTRLYGGKEGPVIVGLERCEEFRNNRPLNDASMGTAGMFNTGTNPFAMYLENNCIMPHNTKDRAGGTRWQVPWGKHMLASRKWNNTAKRDERVNKTNVMPIVLVRDPYSWMQSMCKNPYEARWGHKERCPNLIDQKTHSPNPVKVVHYNPETWFDSLAHYWARWYHEYLEADYPRLIVRFEDLHFHAREMIDTICQCAGGTARDPDGYFTYIVDNAKWGAAHTKTKTNMVTAMIKYGTDKNRFKGMSDEDMDFAASVFTPEWMNLFQYEMPKKQKEAWLESQQSKR